MYLYENMRLMSPRDKSCLYLNKQKSVHYFYINDIFIQRCSFRVYLALEFIKSFHKLNSE